MMRTTSSLKAAALAAAAGLFLSATPAAATHDRDPVAEGLSTPLGLAVRSDGTVYVAESFAGRVTKVDRRGRTSVLAQVAGSTAGVAVDRHGRVAYTVTGFPENEEEPPDTFLYRTTRHGEPRLVASPSAYEERVNPDRGNHYGFRDLDPACAAQLPEGFPASYSGIVESNPYAVASVRGGWLVADAAGNSILKVSERGHVRTLAVLPPVPQVVTTEVATGAGLPACVVGETYDGEPVPTDVEVGKDGHYYVTSLPGQPELPGSGSVWRIHHRTGALTQVATGLTGAVDLAVGRDGRIYVAELFAGQVSEISRRGRVSVLATVDSPGAIETGPRGRLYVTTGALGEEGQVITLRP